MFPPWLMENVIVKPWTDVPWRFSFDVVQGPGRMSCPGLQLCLDFLRPVRAQSMITNLLPRGERPTFCHFRLCKWQLSNGSLVPQQLTVNIRVAWKHNRQLQKFMKRNCSNLSRATRRMKINCSVFENLVALRVLFIAFIATLNRMGQVSSLPLAKQMRSLRFCVFYCSFGGLESLFAP